ncbi:MAG: hypothetical protein JWM81_143 [Candidatus Saccharibacteria bacterium]|nr:hypothetical protein [Candidatus Saccharibacteria bacterium]
MKKKFIVHPLMRALTVVVAVAALVSGVTYAALQSQLALVQGNTIQTATADLQLSTNGAVYGRTVQGFSFGALIPGGAPSPTTGYNIYLKNNGTTPVMLKLSANPTLANTDNVDLTKVKVLLTPESGTPMTFTLKELMDGSEAGGVLMPNVARLIPGQVLNYSLQVQLDIDSVNGSSATISNVNFIFNATAVS